MNDDFLYQFHNPPRPQFAAALYQRINQPMTTEAKPRRAPSVLWLRQWFQLKRPFTLQKGIVSAGLAAVTLAALTMAFVPSARAAVIDIIREIVLGPNTTVAQVAPTSGGPSRPLPKDVWVIQTDIGGFGGNAAPGSEPTVRSVDTLEEAQALAGYRLRAPAELPAGYALREVKLAPMWTSTWAILFYSGPGRDLVIAEMPGGPQPSQDPNVAVAIKNGAVTNGSVEALDFDGRPAAWMDGHALLWEADGISFEVGGLDLDLPAVLAIARSLR